MKKLFSILAAVLLTASVFAQSPEKMSYQAVVRDGSNNLVTSSAVGMQLSILQGSASGTAVYVETQTPTSNANGLVSVEIGSGTVVSGTFATIDWSNGPYFIKTETDPTGGTSYTITGTSQLLSVPYALHAKTAESVTGTITETDPVFGASVASGITGTDTTYWNNKLDSYNETDPVFGAWDKSTGISITESQISDLQSYLTSEVDGSVTNEIQALSISNDTIYLSNGGFVKLPAGFDGQYSSLTGTPTNVSSFTNDAGYLTSFTEIDGSVTNEIELPTSGNAGDMAYWNGTAWITVAAGNEGQILSFVGGVPTWITVVGDNDVKNPTTGKIWMDRNLGASQVATSSTDAAAYGDLYQWGRATDGHQIRTSGTTATNATTAVPNDGNAWDGFFITEGSSPYDWLTPQDDNLWQGVSGTNNPCPSGYRLPTEAEWEAERTSWSSNNNAAGAFASPLKLPVAGYRGSSNGSLGSVGSNGRCWSSTVGGTYSRVLYFDSSDAYMNSNHRAGGFSVRCLKD